MCGDSTSVDDVAFLMNGRQADLWLTDPPYNVSYEGGTEERLTIQNDSMDSESFLKFLRDAFGAAVANIKPGAAFYIWHADTERRNFQTACEDCGLQIRECIIWVKPRLVLGRQDYQWRHEPCLYGWKDGAPHRWFSDRSQTTVIEVDKPTANKDHPTMKPVALFAYLIQNSSRPGEIVFDDFAGSGTSIVACEQLGRECYSMELDPRYCDVIRRRWWRVSHGSDEGWEEATPLIQMKGEK